MCYAESNAGTGGGRGGRGGWIKKIVALETKVKLERLTLLEFFPC